MARKLTLGAFLMTLVFTAFATPVFAAEGGEGGGMDSQAWVYIVAGFSMAFASAMCGYAQGKATAAACEGIARNPSAAGAIRTSMIIGLALIESLALYVLVIVFAKVG